MAVRVAADTQRGADPIEPRARAPLPAADPAPLRCAFLVSATATSMPSRLLKIVRYRLVFIALSIP